MRCVDKLPQLLVDGYNVLHAWGLLGKSRVRELDLARQRLVEDIRCIHDTEQCATTIVFDGSGERAARDSSGTDADFEIIFASSGKTADDIIESIVAKSGQPAACVVATADNLERETVLAAGASCISPDELRAWAERCRKRLARAQTTKSARAFGNKLPL